MGVSIPPQKHGLHPQTTLQEWYWGNILVRYYYVISIQDSNATSLLLPVDLITYLVSMNRCYVH